MVVVRGGGRKQRNHDKKQNTGESMSLNQPCPVDPERTNNLQWTLLFDRLSETVNGIYQLCEKTRNEMSCKEASLVLGNFSRDFENLITQWDVERRCELTDSRPKAVAWEIRKAVGSQITGNERGPTVFGTPILLPRQAAAVNTPPPAPLNECSDTTDFNGDGDGEDGWLLVRRGRRRNTAGSDKSSSSHNGNSQNHKSSTPPEQPQPLHYNNQQHHQYQYNHSDDPYLIDRSSARTPDGGRRQVCMYPRSAMDIPQTRASMAKMAYSRKWLWEKKQDELRAKWTAQHRSYKRLYSLQLQSAKSRSYPTLNRLGAGSISAHKGCHSTKGRIQSFVGGRSRLSADGLANSGPSLGSIKEEHVNSDQELTVDALDDDAHEMSLHTNVISDADIDDDLKNLTEEEASLAMEEESLQKEIEQEERSSVDMCSQMNDQWLSDAAPVTGDQVVVAPINNHEDDNGSGQVQAKANIDKDKPMNYKDIVARWQAQSEAFMTVEQELSWAEMVERELAARQAHLRAPGEVIQMHEKLSSPSRKPNPENIVKKQEERQAKADELRKDFMQSKASRLKELSNRVEEVRAKRREVEERKKTLMLFKMERAQGNREQVLRAVVRRAKDDQEKVHEIQFINQLEAGNKKLDILMRQQNEQQRLNELQANRQKRIEQKALHGQAVEERRRQAAEERQLWAEMKAEKTKQRQLEAATHKSELEKERLQASKQKAKDHEERISELKAQVQARHRANTFKSLRRIEESRQRHESTLQQIRDRASLLGSPRPATSQSMCSDDKGTHVNLYDCTKPLSVCPYEKPRFCTACRVVLRHSLDSAVHSVSATHMAVLMDLSSESLKSEFNDVAIVDVDDETLLIDDRAEKMQLEEHNRLVDERRQAVDMHVDFSAYDESVKADRLSSKSAKEFRNLSRCLSDLAKSVDAQLCLAPESRIVDDMIAVERLVVELWRLLKVEEQRITTVLQVLRVNGGLHVLYNIWLLFLSGSVNLRCACTSLSILLWLIDHEPDVLGAIHQCQLTETIIQLICHCLQVTRFTDKSLVNDVDVCIQQLLNICDKLMGGVGVGTGVNNNQVNSIDTVDATRFKRYVGCSGVLECVSELARSLVVDCRTLDATVINRLLSLTVRINKVFVMNALVAQPTLVNDACSSSSSALTLLDSGYLPGLLCLVYRCIFEQPVDQSITITTVHSLFGVLHALSGVHDELLEAGGGTGGVFNQLLLNGVHRVELYNVACQLVRSMQSLQPSVAQSAILMLARCAALHYELQSATGSGTQPSMLEQLCCLPFSYFVDDSYTRVLMPALIACTYNNTGNVIVALQHLSVKYLTRFIQEQSTRRDSVTDAYALHRVLHRELTELSQFYVGFEQYEMMND